MDATARNLVSDNSLQESGNGPVFVDLDDTLIQTDLLHESFLKVLRYHPKLLLRLPGWLGQGKSYLKQQLSEVVDIDPRALPYNEELISWLEMARAQGRKVYLATASHEKYAHQIAEHLGIFDGVLATTSTCNLKGTNKLKAIELMAPNGFAYAGDCSADMPIWTKAAQIITVNTSKHITAQLPQGTPMQHFKTPKASLKVLLKGIRIHQWVKNILLFLPLILGHQFSNVNSIWQTVVGFFAFSFCASSVYVLNDLLDLPTDRLHPHKKNRPFASGRLSVMQGLLLAPALLIAAFAMALPISKEFVAMLLGYYVITSVYSFGLKKVQILDVTTLTVLFTWRILSGSVASEVPTSPWLLLFSIFFFYSLALAKRATELIETEAKVDSGRGYVFGDLQIVASLGTASGYVAILVMGLYINSPEVKVLYTSPLWLWPISLVLLYWVSRIWLITMRGQLSSDPIVFAIKDKVSYLMGFSVLIMGALAKWI